MSLGSVDICIRVSSNPENWAICSSCSFLFLLFRGKTFDRPQNKRNMKEQEMRFGLNYSNFNRTLLRA